MSVTRASLSALAGDNLKRGAAGPGQASETVKVMRKWEHPLGEGVYEGEWEGDAWTGRGTYTWSNGDRYVGQ
eukprot:213453-Rhodomonas_salina.5